MYRTLDPDKIIDTIAKLHDRIVERFAERGLRNVCRELLDTARESKVRVGETARPNLVLRVISGSLTLLGLAALVWVGTIIEVKRDAENLFGVLQGLDSAFNILVLMGAAVLFLAGLEARWKRQSVLADLHKLRSIIHVIDMHQLTKDPSAVGGPRTLASPERGLTPYELVRYLDYCSEMLSLSAKVAALYAQGSRDPVVVEAASDLGQITTNMSGKIWQKITLVQGLALLPTEPGVAAAAFSAATADETARAGKVSPA